VEKATRADKNSWNHNEEKRINKLKIRKALQSDDTFYREELRKDAEDYIVQKQIDVKEEFFGVRKGKQYREIVTNLEKIVAKNESRTEDWYKQSIAKEAEVVTAEKEKATKKAEEEEIKKTRRNERLKLTNNTRARR